MEQVNKEVDSLIQDIKNNIAVMEKRYKPVQKIERKFSILHILNIHEVGEAVQKEITDLKNENKNLKADNPDHEGKLKSNERLLKSKSELVKQHEDAITRYKLKIDALLSYQLTIQRVVSNIKTENISPNQLVTEELLLDRARRDSAVKAALDSIVEERRKYEALADGHHL